jgi:PAS domain S-box-containing protein
VVGGVLVNLFVLFGISLVTHREIRTRERAEEALESANTEAKEVLDASTQVSIIATDLGGRITLFNRGAEVMLGYRAAELVGHESLLVLHIPSELEARARELGPAIGETDSGFAVLTAPIRRDVAEERDWTYVRKDGTELSVTLSVTPKHDRQGVLSGYLAIALDVSEKHRVDRRQAVQHAATQALGESVTLEDAIPKALEALGRGSAQRSSASGRWTPRRRRSFPLVFWSASERGEPFVAISGTLSLAPDEDLPGRVWASGAPIWYSDLSQEPSFPRASAASAAGLRAGFACPVALGGDVLAVIEIFGEKKEEQDPLLLEILNGIGTQIAQFMERDAADRARRAGDERTKAIVENMLEGLIVVNNRSLIVSANRAAERMFGYESWELLGQHLALLVPVRGTVAETEASLKDARLRSVGRITEWKGRRKNGDLFPFELSLYEFDTPEGRLFAGHVRDISERLRLDRMKKEFVANVSHELRTPLTSIRGSLSLLSSGVLGELPDEAREVVAIAERNTLRLIALINDILDLERLESGQLETQIVATSLRTAAERSLDAMSSFADAQNIFLTSSVPEVEVMGDGDRLVQVLVNLLSNAVKFSERDSSVELTAEVANGTVLVRVTDHGRGIPPDAIGRLFPALPPGRSLRRAREGGHRARPCHLQGNRRAAWRRNRSGERGRPRQHLLVPRARGAARGLGRRPSRVCRHRCRSATADRRGVRFTPRVAAPRGPRPWAVRHPSGGRRSGPARRPGPAVPGFRARGARGKHGSRGDRHGASLAPALDRPRPRPPRWKRLRRRGDPQGKRDAAGHSPARVRGPRPQRRRPPPAPSRPNALPHEVEGDRRAVSRGRPQPSRKRRHGGSAILKVLIVDDEPDIRRIARLSLARLGGMEVIEASNGDEGLDLARDERPDAILLDVMMPGRDGPSTLAALRADARTAAIPVVFLTAKAMRAEVDRLRSLGATGVLTKPFDPMTLAADLRAALERGPQRSRTPGTSPRFARRSAPDELQVAAHVGLDRGGTVGLELRPPVEAHVGQRIDHGLEVDLSLAEVVGVVLEVHLADARAAQPTDLFHHVEPGLGGVADIVVSEHGWRLGPFHDAHVVLGRDGVLESEDDPAFWAAGATSFRASPTKSISAAVSSAPLPKNGSNTTRTPMAFAMGIESATQRWPSGSDFR